MTTDLHENFQHMIDESLAGAISTEREQALREHLNACTPCQEYLGASNRVISGLAGFSFEVDPTLNARIVASLQLQAQQVQAAQPGGRQWVLKWMLISLAAIVLTVSGSFVDLQFGSLIAPVFDMQRAQLQQGLLAFWIAPSLAVFLLFPLLPWLSRAATHRQERSL